MRFFPTSGSARILLNAFLMVMFGSSATIVQAGEYSLAPMRKAPKVDGIVEADEWKEALQVAGFVDRDAKLVARHGRFAVGRTAENLYFAIVSELPPGGNILARVQPGNGNDSAVALDDTVEIWLSPFTGDGKEMPLYQLVLNPKGAMYAVKHDKTSSAVVGSWSPDATLKTRLHEGAWHVEVGIPLRSIGADGASLPGVNFRVARTWRQPYQPSSSEAFTQGGFAHPGSMSRIWFDSSAPFVHQGRIMTPERRELVLKVDVEAVAAPASAKAKMEVNSTSNMSPRVLSRTLELGKGSRESLALGGELFRDTEFNLSLLLESPKTGKALFRRELVFSTTGSPEDGWAINQTGKSAQYQIAYSPYRSQLLLKALGKGRPASLKIVSTEAKKEVFENTFSSGDWPRFEAVKAVDLPPLETGDYQISLSDEKGKLLQRFPLRVEVFGWEKNRIGEEKRVPSPYKPVAVEGSKAAVLLREYSFNTCGLLSSLTADGIPLLKKESTLTARIGGKVHEAKGKNLQLVAMDDGGADLSARWSLGPIEGQTRGNIAYDGFIRYDFIFPAAEGETVEELTLKIPVADSEVSLMYSIGAGIRGNFAGAVPQGEGIIWTNLEGMAYGYPNGFIPYLWVGGLRRGLAVMADSSTNWSIKKGEASLRIIREGGTLTLELHLVSEPVRLDRERVISLYCQATPLKEKPHDWRRYVFRNARYQNAETVLIHASCPYWGAASKYGDVYPRGRDFQYIEKLVEAKNTRAVTPELKKYIEQWNEGNAGAREEKLLNAHTVVGFRNATVADKMIPYTNARDVRENLPEFQIYQDEWISQGFTARKWADDPTGLVKINPVQSFQDFALWYFRKMKEAGYASGIYFDNDFLVASQNPFETFENAKLNGDAARPSVGLITLRDYFRRCYVLFTEGDHPAMNVLHMTNAAIAPHLSFTTIQLDWEIKFGSEDFQDRFSEEYIFASSLGEQFGTVPVVLSGIFPSKEKSANWLTRTIFGVATIYELKVWPGYHTDTDALHRWLRILYDFGYGLEECEVYRYWETPPFSLNRQDVRAIVMKAKGKILCVITDFGNGGETALSLKKTLLGDATYTARDAESGKAIDWDGESLGFSLKKHDFKIILLQPQAPLQQ